MAKILISSLGTGIKKEGGYKKAIYELNGKKETTTFISKALSKFLDIDKIFLVGTKGSIWDSCYREFGGESDDTELLLYEKILNKDINEDDLKVVSKVIEQNLWANGSKCYLIDYGLNDDELWSNFDKYLDILNEINDGDIVYIDISHAFRSLALMSFLMVQFGHGVKNKNFKIGGIYYGMLEYARENSGVTPIVDLKIFYDLMEWIKAIEAFKNYGHADLMVKLFESEDNIKSQTKDTFNMFDINLSMANMSALRKFIDNAKRVLPVLQKSENNIVRLISPDIEEFIKRLDKPKVSEFQLELAIWFCENRNYALSYIVLVEALVTKECEKLGLNLHSKDDRNMAKKSLYDANSMIYKRVANIRNNIAHQRESRNLNIKKDIEDLKKYLNELKGKRVCIN